MKYSWLIILCCLILSCEQATSRRPINKKEKQKTAYSVVLNQAVNKFQEDQIDLYTKKDSLLNYKTSPFGFVYAITKSSHKPKKAIRDGTYIVFEKTVYSLKNELIYPTERQNCTIGKSNEIVGIEEGLKIMREDEEIKFIFTSFVAHGFNGDQNKIGRNMPIIVKIKLLNINN